MSVLKFLVVLLVGYVICCTVAVLWSQRGFADGFRPDSMLMSAVHVVLLGIIPINLMVISVSIVSVQLRNFSWLPHLGGVIAASLLVPILGNLFIAFIAGRKEFLPILFLPALCSGLGIVWLTRKLFRADPSP